MLALDSWSPITEMTQCLNPNRSIQPSAINFEEDKSNLLNLGKNKNYYSRINNLELPLLENGIDWRTGKFLFIIPLKGSALNHNI